MNQKINFIFSFLFILFLSFSNASISGYSEAAVESAPKLNCEGIDSTSEAKATDANPFCVYPALVGDHPSPKLRPGPINSGSFES
ncbi:hypothetical protein ACQ4LE_010065 [Meloidogyne hapla]